MLNELAKEVHKLAVEKGWWDREVVFGNFISRCHCELSEAVEEYGNGHKPAEIRCERICAKVNGKPSCEGCERYKPGGIPIELADCIIRILDWCAANDVDIDEAIRLKHEYNRTRPYRHGGKVI